MIRTPPRLPDHRRSPESHVCWVVQDPSTYREAARALLDDALARHRKTAAFGPDGSDVLADLAPSAAIVADPRTAFLDGRHLDADAMFAMFREQTALARSEGYEGLNLVADMDWLLPLEPSLADVVGFEVLLDRVVAELDAVVVCAYRTSSFAGATIQGALCVHPAAAGPVEDPPFRVVADDEGAWHLLGEVDLSMVEPFAAALHAVGGATDAVIDVSRLEFIDVAGLHALASTDVARLVLQGARPTLRRSWELAGFAQRAPWVELAA